MILDLPPQFIPAAKPALRRSGLDIVADLVKAMPFMIGFRKPSGVKASPTLMGATITVKSGTNSTAPTFNLPSGIVAGEMLIAFIDSRGTTNPVLPPSGWTATDLGTSTSSRYTVMMKLATGAEGATATCSCISAIQISTSCMRWANLDPTTLAPVHSSFVVASTTAPNPPALTSGFGLVNTLWMAMLNTDTSITGDPSGYTNTQIVVNSGTDRTKISFKVSNIATEDPGPWTAGSNCSVMTFAFKPA